MARMNGCTKEQLENFAEFCLVGAMGGHFEHKTATLIMMAAWDFLDLGELQIIEKSDGTFDVKEKEENV